MKNVLKYKKATLGVLILSVMVVFSLTVAFATNQVAVAIVPHDTEKNAETITYSDTQNGVTVSIESIHGGNNTVFIKLKLETDEIVFDDNFEYGFGLWGIDFKQNINDFGKNLINGGGTSIEVDKEFWTEHIRYLGIEMRVLYDAGVNFSLGDGQERVMTLEYFGYYDTTDYNSWHKLGEGTWQLKFSYYANDKDINVNFEPFMFYGKGLMGSDRLAQMTSIRLNRFGMVCNYTALEIQEALDFTADIIMKDGTKATLIKSGMSCATNLEGFMTFKSESDLDLDEIAYIQIGDEMIAIYRERISQN